MAFRYRVLVLLLWGCYTSVCAQTPGTDTLTASLPDIRVEAARSAGGVATAPFSIAVTARGPLERASDPGLSLDIALRQLPGVFLSNRENPALGERLIVRGLGYRAGFGVRGVQVVLDGIPLTLADGQAVLGIVDPAFIRRAEIIRGPASALWGNGSGGVLFLSTVPEGEEGSGTARALAGSHGSLRAEAEAMLPVGPHRAGLTVSHTRSEGYRAHSAFETTRARLFGEFRIRPSALLRLITAIEAAPLLEHPGALTAEEQAADPQQAELRYVNARAGKTSTQVQAAATLQATTPAALITATTYGITRKLGNPLPFAVINVDRLAGGIRLGLEKAVFPFYFTLGTDAAIQHDDRTNAPNEGGQAGQNRTLDQVETVTQGALFARLRVDLAPIGIAGLALEGALRGDRVRFKAHDRLLTDGDQSGARALGAWSPQLGLSYRKGAALFFASFATAFETPTTTELVNRPDGEGGFNPVLQPQQTTGLEAGIRGVTTHFLYDVALYALRVRNGLTPSEGVDGRTYYLNRGVTQHRGAEVFIEWQPRKATSASLSYTWSHLRFGRNNLLSDGTEVEGNILPGVPEHRLSSRLQVIHGRFSISPSAALSSGIYPDDLNTVKTAPALTVDLAITHTQPLSGKVRLLSFLRLQNAFDAQYAGSVVINARRGRFYEPARRRSAVFGVGVSW